MDYKYNGKQSHATRLEMFIALNYLLDNCPSEKRTSKTVELQAYAMEHFNEFVDRRKADDIFDDLVEFTRDYPGVIPYTVVRVGNKPRYFVKKNLFSDIEIKKIAYAVKDYGGLTEKASDQLIGSFLDKATDQEKKKQVLGILHKTPSMVKRHITDAQMGMIDKLIWLRDNKARFYFKLNRRPDPDDVVLSTPLRLPPVMAERERKRVKPIYPGYYAGYVYEVTQTAKSTKVCIYMPDYKNAVITNANNVVLNDLYSPFPPMEEPIFELKGPRTIDDWYTSYFKGQAGHRKTTVTFKFCAGLDLEAIPEMKAKFEAFFKEGDMKYALQERRVKRKHLDGSEDFIAVQDAVVKVECCYGAFEKWYWESRAFEKVVVLEPADWNDRLLSRIIERFAARLTKYGTRFDYELGMRPKPEFEQQLKEREERFLAWKARREQRLKAQEQQAEPKTTSDSSSPSGAPVQ